MNSASDQLTRSSKGVFLVSSFLSVDYRRSFRDFSMMSLFAKSIHRLLLHTARGNRCRTLSVVSKNLENSRLKRSEKTKHLIKNVQKQNGENMVKIGWSDGSQHRFPFVFLRDNCQCKDCFNAQTSQRLCDVQKIAQIDLSNKVSLSHDDDKIQIKWSDGHVSEFNSDWLRERLIPEQIGKFNDFIGRECVLWGSEMSNTIPAVDFSNVMEEGEGMFKWLDNVRRYGVALITNTPKEMGQLKVIGERVGVLKSTLYGPTLTIVSRNQPFNIAYTNSEFGCHTDLSYYDQTGGIALLHYIAQASKGGETVLVDGFNIAQQLYEHHPDLFSILRGIALPFLEKNIYKDQVKEFDHHNWTAPFQFDPYGKIKRFCYNESSRDSYLHVPLSEVEKFYEAYWKLTELIRDPKNTVIFKVEPGNIITTNNLRVMHGRKSFEIGPNEKRLLEVGYIDWDVGFSKMRLLANKLGLTMSRSTPYTEFS